MLFTMLTGAYPFSPDYNVSTISQSETFRAISIDRRLKRLVDIGALPTMGDNAVDLLQRMLTADPATRLVDLDIIKNHPFVLNPTV